MRLCTAFAYACDVVYVLEAIERFAEIIARRGLKLPQCQNTFSSRFGPSRRFTDRCLLPADGAALRSAGTAIGIGSRERR